MYVLDLEKGKYPTNIVQILWRQASGAFDCVHDGITKSGQVRFVHNILILILSSIW
jgi:hypothetical protein